jgi:hypothetical protein
MRCGLQWWNSSLQGFPGAGQNATFIKQLAFRQ